MLLRYHELPPLVLSLEFLGYLVKDLPWNHPLQAVDEDSKTPDGMIIARKVPALALDSPIMSVELVRDYLGR